VCILGCFDSGERAERAEVERLLAEYDKKLLQDKENFKIWFASDACKQEAMRMLGLATEELGQEIQDVCLIDDDDNERNPYTCYGIRLFYIEKSILMYTHSCNSLMTNYGSYWRTVIKWLQIDTADNWDASRMKVRFPDGTIVPLNDNRAEYCLYLGGDKNNHNKIATSECLYRDLVGGFEQNDVAGQIFRLKGPGFEVAIPYNTDTARAITAIQQKMREAKAEEI
jgi:hypothetical protein